MEHSLFLHIEESRNAPVEDVAPISYLALPMQSDVGGDEVDSREIGAKLERSDLDELIAKVRPAEREVSSPCAN